MGTEELCFLHILPCKGLLPSITFLTGKQASVLGLGEDFTALECCPKGAETGEAWESPRKAVTSSFAVCFQSAGAPKETFIPALNAGKKRVKITLLL